MNAKNCKNCGQEFQKWVEFCSNCSEPMEGYSQPAGFWIRFGASGGYCYTLETPPGFVPLDFGNEFVLGLERDDLGVERITLRPIHFPEE